jgi:tRNA (guanine-N7-)-methyltransferase
LDQHLSNIRIYDQDAVEVLKQCIPDNSLAGVQLFFPDPWHKKRHHKRRLVQPEFVKLIWQKLAHNGFFHLATDWEPYAEHMMEVLSKDPGFSNSAGANQFIPRPESRPLTKFEQRGQKLGHGVWDLLFIKTA